MNGIPFKPKLRNVRTCRPSTAPTSPRPRTFDNRIDGLKIATFDRRFAMAAASLRQALQENPEIAELSKNVMIEESKDGLDIQIVDQDGRSMFADGSKYPYERTAS